MLHVFNPELAEAKAHRPNPHAHHAHELRRIRQREKAAARRAFLRAARAFLQASLARLKKSVRLDEKIRRKPSVVLPKFRRGAAKCEFCA